MGLAVAGAGAAAAGVGVGMCIMVVKATCCSSCCSNLSLCLPLPSNLACCSWMKSTTSEALMSLMYRACLCTILNFLQAATSAGLPMTAGVSLH